MTENTTQKTDGVAEKHEMCKNCELAGQCGKWPCSALGELLKLKASLKQVLTSDHPSELVGNDDLLAKEIDGEVEVMGNMVCNDCPLAEKCGGNYCAAFKELVRLRAMLWHLLEFPRL